MWKFFTENSHADADARQYGLGECGSDGEAVDEVVNAVAEDDHPRDSRNFRAASLRFQLKVENSDFCQKKTNFKGHVLSLAGYRKIY